MNLRNISAWSIRNPIIPIVLFAGLLVAGLLSFNRMTVSNFPDIDFPASVVLVVQPGAAPTEIETQVTQKVEAAVRSIPGVTQISSTASEGSSQTVVEFEIGEDPDVANNRVSNAVDQIRADLPDGILEPQVQKIEAGGGGNLASFAVNADDMTIEELSWFVDDTVSRNLLSVNGMASVSRSGGVDREIRVVLDPAKMQGLGVTASQLNRSLRALNLNAAGGRVEIAGARQSVRVLGNADTAYDLSQTEIDLGGGRAVKLSEVATVSDGYSEVDSIALLNGRQVVTFSFQRARGASDVEVYDTAVEKLTKIEEQNPGVHFTRLFTTATYTKGQYSSSMAALIEGAVLAIVVVFLFLRDWRATIISAIAIPLSAIPTFWFMELMGFNLNFLSLLALSLVAGVLVDDAIVEIENIVRHMRMGETPYQASIDAADEIGLAVVATTFSIVAVFLPVGLMPGIPGQFFKNFGLTVVVAVLMSLAVARMVTPMVAAYFLKSHGHASHGEGRAMDAYIGVLGWTLDQTASNKLLAKLKPVASRWWYYFVLIIPYLIIAAATIGAAIGAYQLMDWVGLPQMLNILICPFVGVGVGWLMGWALKFVLGMFGRFGSWYDYVTSRASARMRDHRFYAFCIGIYALIVTGALLANMPQQFDPESDEDSSRVNVEMVPGTTLEQTAEVTAQVRGILSEYPEVVRVFERVNEGNARISIGYVDRDERDLKSFEFENKVAPKFLEIPDARVTFASQAGGFGSGRDLTVMLSGTDPVLLDETADTLVEQMSGVKGVVAPRIAADLQRPELHIKPRQDLASNLGVSTAALSEAIRIATIGENDQTAAKFSLTDRQIPIRVVLDKSSRRDVSVIENLPVPTATGGSVPLKRVADISFGAGPTQIQRFNQSRRVLVGADLGEGEVKGPVMERINALPIMENLPSGISTEPVGEDQWQGELIESFTTAVLSGIFLVFAVLVLLYRRFVSPLVNMTSLLLAPLGGLIALLILGQPISMPVYIGILMLLGIVAKNSILLIDFAIDEMDAGVPKHAAIMDAGHKRAQPIVMTTVAMTAGMIPTALSLSGDGAWRQPMGVVVIGGLILSTVLTLVIVPAGFSLADGFERKVGPWLRRTFLTYDPDGDDSSKDAEAGDYASGAAPQPAE